MWEGLLSLIPRIQQFCTEVGMYWAAVSMQAVECSQCCFHTSYSRHFIQLLTVNPLLGEWKTGNLCSNYQLGSGGEVIRYRLEYLFKG